MRKDFDRIVRQAMAERGIKTVKELADKINALAGHKVISANSIGKWLRKPDKRKAVPKATSLMFLCKALKINADLLLYDEGENPEYAKSLERMVTSIVKAEVQKASTNIKRNFDEMVCRFFDSKDIPDEDKNSILRQIRNLLKLYGGGDKDA